MKKALFSLTVLVMILLTSCTKPGPTGPAGLNGTNGKDGNANVIATNTVALTSSNWTASGEFYYATLTSNLITQAIVDKGVVMVYEQLGTSWTALPYAFGILSVSFDFGLNTVHIYHEYTDNSQTANPGNQTYRIVIISASVAEANPNVNWGNYEEVMELVKY